MTPADIPRPVAGARIWSFTEDGRRYWAKRRESLGLRMRLQKGDPAAGFDRERAAIRELSARGVPVGPIVAEDESCFVTPDHGPTLADLLRADAPETRNALVAAAHALAALHAKGLSHGRPSLKDICWDGASIHFIDLERYASERNTARGHAWDVIVFVFNGLAVAGGDTSALAAARAAYREADSVGIWKIAARIVRRLSPVSWLTWPVRKLVPGAAEFRAVPETLRIFRTG